MNKVNINNTSVRPLSWVKRCLVKEGRRHYQVPIGLYRGLHLQLDLQNDMQTFLGLWERETHGFIRLAASRCDWVIDVGAGKGELGLYFLKHSRAKQILAFEPQAAELGLLRDNLALNQESRNQRLLSLSCFVGDSRELNCVALDSLNVDLNGSGFIKIDVDGYEMHVLRSGESLFSCGRLMLLLETHSKELEDECAEWLVCRGYAVSIIRNAWWRLVIPEQRPIAHNRWLWATKRG